MNSFGEIYMLDIYHVSKKKCHDMNLMYNFLIRLANALNMDTLCPPIVIREPVDRYGNSLYPDKSGCSAWLGLVTSGIQVHTLAEKNFISLDVYSCNFIDTEAVKQLVSEVFETIDFEENFLQRGTKYYA